MANEVFKTLIAKNLTIVMLANEQFLAYYIFTSPLQGEKTHLRGASLEVVLDKFSTLVSPNCKNFMVRSKRLIRSGMSSMDSIMALKDHFAF